MLVKAELVVTISRLIRERGLTQAAAAQPVGSARPRRS